MIEDLGERTEAATPRRRQEAREQGLVARSQDLGGAIVLLVATLALWGLAMSMLGQGRVLILESLADASDVTPDLGGAGTMLHSIGVAALRLALPVLAIMWLAALASQFLQVGWLFVPKAAAPNVERVNPLTGIGRIFGVAGVAKSGGDVLKVSVVVAIAAITLAACATRIATLPYMSALQALREGGVIVLTLALRVVAALLLLGILDFMHQRWRLSRDLRMTRQQVNDELKQSDGNVETKRRRMRVRRQQGFHRLPDAVSQADFLLIDEDRIAIALAFDESTMAAPRVVAKGMLKLARRIREMAAPYEIPVINRSSLARVLYSRIQVDAEIPAEHYKDVAELMAYAYRVKRRAA